MNNFHYKAPKQCLSAVTAERGTNKAYAGIDSFSWTRLRKAIVAKATRIQVVQRFSALSSTFTLPRFS